MPKGSNSAKTQIHTFLIQIARKMRLRVSSESAISGPALDLGFITGKGQRIIPSPVKSAYQNVAPGASRAYGLSEE